MRKLFLATTLALFFGSAVADEAPQLAKMVASQPLLAKPVVEFGSNGRCQLLAGDTVSILAIKKNPDGMMGYDFARVAVTGGRCTGLEGWVGAPNLQTIAP